MEKKKPRRIPTEYQCIYRQTDKDLYDVRYNYKELNEDTGKTEYKTKWVYGVKSIDLAKKTLLQLQSGTYDDGEITLQEAYELWLAKAKIERYTDVAVKNTGEHIRMIYTVLSPDLKLRDVDFSLYSSFIECCRVERGYSEYHCYLAVSHILLIILSSFYLQTPYFPKSCQTDLFHSL